MGYNFVFNSCQACLRNDDRGNRRSVRSGSGIKGYKLSEGYIVDFGVSVEDGAVTVVMIFHNSHYS